MICLIMATLLEAEPFITGLSLKKVSSYPFPEYHKDQCCLILCGVGKVNAAMATSYACISISPDLICNLGAAGSNTETLIEGAVYHIEKVFEYDRLHFRSKRPYLYKPDTVKGFENVSLATQDCAVVLSHEREALSEIAVLADMEGAAVVQVAKRFGVPCFLFKQVSDTPKHYEDQDIVRNIRKYRGYLFDIYENQIEKAVFEQIRGEKE